MKKVLVTGGLGYIGSHVVKMLEDRGYEVTILDNNLYNLKVSHDYIKDDAYNIARYYSSEYEAVIALAGIVGDEACLLDTRRTEYSNYHTTIKLAGLNMKRLIFASTCSVYGSAKEIVNEESKCKPLSVYAHTKLRSEKLILETENIGTKTILRLPTLFGYSQRPRFDLVVNLFIAKAYFNKKIQVFGGEQLRPFCHVKDVARCLVDLVERPHANINNEIFNLGGLNYSISEIASMIARSIPGTEVQTLEEKDDMRDYKVDFSKATDIIGFEPAYNLNYAINEFEDAFKANEVNDYTLSFYHNYNRLKELELGLL